MKKELLTVSMLIISVFALGQLGINNTDPKATFDVTAKTTNASTAEGIIAPRLTGDQIQVKDAKYSADQTGAILYATSAVTVPAGVKTASITAPGYYYFDGLKWLRASDGADLRVVGTDNHITSDAGVLSNGSSAGTGTGNIAIGLNTLSAVTTGFENTIIGTKAGKSLTTGKKNTFAGIGSGASMTTGSANVFLGEQAGASSTTPNYNVALGANTLQSNVTGGALIAIGFNALNKTTATNNIAIGYDAMSNNTSGRFNTAIGSSALKSNTTAYNNVAIGVDALGGATIGGANVAIGGSALGANTSGINNTAVGVSALQGITTGSYNIGLGSQAAGITTGFNNLVIGYFLGVPSPSGSNQMNIMNSLYGLNLGDATRKIGINTIAPTNTLHVAATADPLRLEGLQAGAGNDKIVVADASGVLKNLMAKDLDFSGLPTYDNDGDAGAGGLTSGKMYKTAAGDLKIKL